jgi:hypothetical protein
VLLYFVNAGHKLVQSGLGLYFGCANILQRFQPNKGCAQQSLNGVFMKKSVLALSITAAIVGFAGGAQAMTGALGGAGATTTLALNQDGIGQMLLVPYYSAQAENNTLLTLVNTDTLRGKAVKVRFRGAANSDDVFDFQVFLSPGDVWTAAIAKGADGRAQLTTSDATCTKPSAAVLNATPFVTDRLDPTLDAAGKANGTREGYVEIFNMGDIPKGIVVGGVVVADALAATTAGFSTDATVAVNPLYTAIKHVAKVAPCSGAAWTNLDTTNLQWDTVVAAATTPRSAGLLPPTTGLMANWTIINTVGAAAWSGKAEAIVAGTAAAPAAGNVVYWPQTGTTIDPTAYTADPLLRKGVGAQVYGHNATTDTYTAEVTTAAVNAGNYDLPDMSTPYTAAADVAPGTAPTPFVQARNLTAAIAASSATNEFLTENGAKTDWVFSQPTRRYSTSLNYAAISATDDGRRFSNLFAVTALGDAATDIGVNAKTDFTTKSYFAGDTTLVTSRQICVKGPGISVWDREETTLTASTDVVVSPSTPAAALSFCGEDTVLSVNNGGIQAAGTGALKATVAVKDLDVTYIDGWMTLTTPGAHGVVGLPVLGSAFEKANAGTSSFGVAYPHRFAR